MNTITGSIQALAERPAHDLRGKYADDLDAAPFRATLEQVAVGAERAATARRVAAQFVADAFITPALASLRDGPFAPTEGPFATTAAERQFGPMLDTILAERLTERANFPIIDTVARRLLGERGRNPVAAYTAASSSGTGNAGEVRRG